MVGTTDDVCEISHNVITPKLDVDFVIKELRSIFGENFDYEKGMLSAWSGIRPLVKEYESDRKTE